MFRGLIDDTASSLRKFNLAIQLDPRTQSLDGPGEESIKKYLKKYFKDVKFDVDWNTTHGFVQSLWEKCGA
jgi:hypothetical protein